MIYGFVGHATSGKDTAADALMEILEERGETYSRRSLADPIKQLAKQHFGWDGKKTKKGRQLLIELGMAGRAYDESIWLNKALDYFHCSNAIHNIIPDIRFENEADHVFANGILIRVIRDGVKPMEHISERGLDNYLTSIILHNDGTFLELKADLEKQLVALCLL